MVNSLIQHLVISGQIRRFQGKINHLVLFQQNIFCIHCLFQRKPPVVLRIDNHVLFLIRYPVQSDLLSLIVGGQHTVEGYDCHIFADVLRWHGVLISGVGDEAVFCTRLRLILSMMYSRDRGARSLFSAVQRGFHWWWRELFH